MIRNFFTLAFRLLFKNKLYLLINTAGMGIAIACAMTAYLLVAYNIEFDSTVDEDRVKHVVKVLHHRKDAEGDNFKELVAPMVLGPAAIHEIAGITRFSRYFSDGAYVSHGEKGFHETVFFADISFMSMFEPVLASGSHESFSDRNAVFVNETFAGKYFGDEDPIGKELQISINGRQLTTVVGGVLQNAPFNSTFTEKILMRAENYLDVYDIKDSDWATSHNASLLFELTDISLAPTIGRQLTRYSALRNQARPQSRSERYELLPFLQPISPNEVRQSDLHLKIPGIALAIFMALGAVILLIACFNLTNTTLAVFMKRLKEIGIRKVVGSNRLQLAFQFFTEVIITVTISVIAGFAISLYLIPQFASMWQLPYGLGELNAVNMGVALLILLFSCAILAGLYPALFGSRQSPLLLFRGGKGPRGTNIFTRSLLVGQFGLSIAMLIAGVIFTQNAAYQETISFGYDKDRLITALIQGRQEAEVLAQALSSNPKIESISPSIHHFAFINAPERPAEIGTHKFTAAVYQVGGDYFETVGLELVSGRLFSDADTAASGLILVDESFVKANRLEDPLQTRVMIEGIPQTIIGVVNDHLTDLESDRTESYVYALAKPDDYQILVVRCEPSSINETEQYIHKQWKKIFPGRPLKTDLQQDILYEESNSLNRNLSRIFLFMTVLGSLLSVSGLYSMATLNIHRRTKEIGVRKVLGASAMNILKLVNAEFAAILFAAALLGGYGGFIFTDALLSDLFAQHVGASVLIAVLSASSVLAVGIVLTSVIAWTTANANPVKSLSAQ